MQNPTPEKTNFYRSWVFWAVIYGLLILAYNLAFIFLDPEKKVLLTSNELGDFLAGVFAPLAFLFLYLGYKQQGRELQQNTQALNLQAKELQNSVEQQRELVQATKEEIELNKSEIEHQRRIQHVQAQPFFHFKNCFITHDDSKKCFTLMFTLYNSRATCRELDILVINTSEEHVAEPVLIYPRYDLILGNNEKNYIFQPKYLPQGLKFNSNGALILELKLKYYDAVDNEQQQTIKFVLPPKRRTDEVMIFRDRTNNTPHH
ncbi:hypothetical protein L1Z01_20665 [Acinetobacter baumannii]|uniref:hypothetical protein n=1 Tax=Acinetobacter baumannii TaxID=470 RepID=UPI00062C98EF|nr:hypothetical protein [Acinetobacter baumannii]AVN30057.1 hypothetical protein AM467_11725 [Acinetobacter baumannii]KKZ43262.1 hypothetical protein UO01_19900 [Acinetobacter baumannii]KQE83151.1 hypothetical protein APB90_12385 [Acinetobacter baumannii]MCF4430023.1 hypothetical protein [Acinetobacter baumannii]MCF4453133.1 hypothetical protein [Acinetobacter baumannii]